MQQQEMATLFVLDKDRLVGMVTAHDLCKLISLQVELEGGK
jgi:CBS domain-containing protein